MRPLFASLIVASLAFSGFEGSVTRKTLDFVPGTYGVCEGNSQVELRLNKDGSYNYVDNTLKKPLELKGAWTRSGNTIVLGGTGSIKIHDHWKLDQGAPCIKARKGLEWRMLCLTKPE